MTHARILAATVLIAALGASAAPARAAAPSLPPNKLLRATGRVVGYSAGVAVTAALGFSKKWNRPLRDGDGHHKIITVDGFPFVLRARHEPVLGPKVLSKAAKMSRDTRWQRARHSFVLGLGEGATAAPGATARLEARMNARR